MADINPAIPQINEPNSTADPKIVTALNSLIATINALDSSNYADASVTLAKLATDALNKFPKLNTVADKKVEFGSTTVTCSSGGGSGSIAYGTASVTHGMGATPTHVFLTVKSGGTLGGGNVIVGLSSSGVGSTTFTVNASVLTPGTDNINGTVAVSWFAIA